MLKKKKLVSPSSVYCTMCPSMQICHILRGLLFKFEEAYDTLINLSQVTFMFFKHKASHLKIIFLSNILVWGGSFILAGTW